MSADLKSHSNSVDFCPNTGVRISDRSGKFCPACGQPYAVQQATTTGSGPAAAIQKTAAPAASAPEAAKKAALKKETLRKEAPETDSTSDLLPVVYITGPGSKAPDRNYVWKGVIPKDIENPFGRVVFKSGAKPGTVVSIYAWFGDNGPQWGNNIVAYPDGYALQRQAPRNREPLVLRELTSEKMVLALVSEATKPALGQVANAGCTLEWRDVDGRKLPFCLCKPEGTCVASLDACPICGRPTGYKKPTAVPEVTKKVAPAKGPDPAVVAMVVNQIKKMDAETAEKELAAMDSAMKAAVEAVLKPEEPAAVIPETGQVEDLKISTVPDEDLPDGVTIEMWRAAKEAKTIVDKAKLAQEWNAASPEVAFTLISTVAGINGKEIVVFPMVIGPADDLPDGVTIEMWRAAKEAKTIVDKAKLAQTWNPDEPDLDLVTMLAGIGESKRELLPTRIRPASELPDGTTFEQWQEARSAAGFVAQVVLADKWAQEKPAEEVLPIVQSLAQVEEVCESWQPTVMDVKRAKGLLVENEQPIEDFDMGLPTKECRWTSDDLAMKFGNKAKGFGGHVVFIEAAKLWGSESIEQAAAYLVHFARQGLEAVMQVLPGVGAYYESKPQKKSGGNTVLTAIVTDAEKAGITPLEPCAMTSEDKQDLKEDLGEKTNEELKGLVRDAIKHASDPKAAKKYFTGFSGKGKTELIQLLQNWVVA